MKQKVPSAPYYQLMIVNQYGQLQYRLNHDCYPGTDIDSLLGLTSLFYSIDNLQSTIVPERASKEYTQSQIDFLNKNHIQDIETSTFRLSILQTLTGYRFLLLTEPTALHRKNQDSLRQIHKLFTDYALKDPSYSG